VIPPVRLTAAWLDYSSIAWYFLSRSFSILWIVNLAGFILANGKFMWTSAKSRIIGWNLAFSMPYKGFTTLSDSSIDWVSGIEVPTGLWCFW